MWWVSSSPSWWSCGAGGRNLNQLTVLAHTGRVQTVYLRECMEVLGKTYEAVNRLLTEKGGVISHGDV